MVDHDVKATITFMDTKWLPPDGLLTQISFVVCQPCDHFMYHLVFTL